MKIQVAEHFEAEEHFEAMEEQKAMDRDGEVVSTPKFVMIKVQSSREAVEEEGMINLKFNVLIARNMAIMHHIARIIFSIILKKRITMLKEEVKKNMR